MTTANFFWHGKELTLYEVTSLKSFVKKKFKVDVYSYQKLKYVPGVNFINATKIVPKSLFLQYLKNKSNGSLATFSDFFRIKLMKLNKGWWFDMDILCLKNAKDFDKLENQKDIVAGYEDNQEIANGVLKINNSKIIDNLLDEMQKKGVQVSRGHIGPRLLKKIVKEKKLEYQIVNQKYFFPINYTNFEKIFDPNNYLLTKKLYKKSYICHFYNEILIRHNYPKNIFPPKGSFLYTKFCEVNNSKGWNYYLPKITSSRLIGINKTKLSLKEHLQDLIPSFWRFFNK